MSPDGPAVIRHAPVSMFVVAVLAVLVQTGGVHPIDDDIVEWAAGVTADRPGLLAGLELVSELTRPVWVYAVLSLLLLLTGWRARVGRRAGAVWLTLMAVWGSAALLKLIVGRERPPVALIETSGLSFPSGHATNIAAATVGLTLFLWPLVGRVRRALLGTVGIVLVGVVALDRVFLGVHYPIDVLAGVLCGGGLVAAASYLWPPAVPERST